MNETAETFGRTIQLYLVDGTPNGLAIASLHGWTGNVFVASQTTFGKLLARPEVDRAGIYILQGPDPENALGLRVYIGEADSVRDRIGNSAKEREFWETALVVTASDDALNKGHVRYLEARLIELVKAAGRVALDNGNEPPVDRRRLSEADRANMEFFLSNLRVILPVVGVDILKPRPVAVSADKKAADMPRTSSEISPQFEVRHKSGVKAYAVEEDGEFIVLKGSLALKDTDYAHNQYARLKNELIEKGVLIANQNNFYEFVHPYSFNSPSAAGAVVLDRNTNGRTRWYVVGEDMNYHEWQEKRAQELLS